LLKWESAETLEAGAANGAFFETYVFSEIYKSFHNAGMEPPLYYYRDRDKKEIDLLVYRDGVLYPIEMKRNASPGKEALKNFGVLTPVVSSQAETELKTKIGAGAVVCMATDLLPIDAQNWRVPVWLI
jgi:predicted AAA+ superfamily ATPase